MFSRSDDFLGQVKGYMPIKWIGLADFRILIELGYYQCELVPQKDKSIDVGKVLSAHE